VYCSKAKWLEPNKASADTMNWTLKKRSLQNRRGGFVSKSTYCAQNVRTIARNKTKTTRMLYKPSFYAKVVRQKASSSEFPSDM
jgi:hypothetical protein